MKMLANLNNFGIDKIKDIIKEFSYNKSRFLFIALSKDPGEKEMRTQSDSQHNKPR